MRKDIDEKENLQEQITNLQQENERYKHYTKTTGIEELMEEFATFKIENISNLLICYENQQQEIDRLNNNINKALSWTNRTIETIKMQPSEDDSWILGRLNSIKYELQGGDKE